jgi:4-hydroxy-tetrahydrodipicolinate synthase
MRYKLNQAKEWARETLRDYFVTTTMPFLADLSIDEEGLRHNVRHILGLRSTGGIYVGSIYQEFNALTLAERKRVAEIVLNEVGVRVPVMAGISGNCMADVVELGRHATEHGADLVMLWPPSLGLRTQQGVLDFYRRITSQLEIGMCVYATGFGELGFRLTPEMLAELAEIPGVCAVKEASQSIAVYFETVAKVGDRLVVSMPAEEFWLPGRVLFGPQLSSEVFLGTSRPLYCETAQIDWPREFLGAAREGDIDLARDRMLKIRGVADAIFARHHARGAHEIALTKAVTGFFGMATGPVRPPLGYPPAEEIAEARRTLVEAGLLGPGGTAAVRGEAQLVGG